MPVSGSHPSTPSATLRAPWLLALAGAIALLSWFAPRYEAAGVAVAPLAPALAIALAGTALAGWRALPAVALGAALAMLGWPLAAPDAQGILAAFGLLAQAAFGGMLLRRSGRPDDLALDSRPSLRRLLAAAVACGVIGGLLLMLGDLAWSADSSLRPFTVAVVRGTADACSIVLLMPVLMAFVSPHRNRWLTRRRSVALPLLALAVAMALAFVAVDERDRQQAQQRFERDAEVVFARTQSLLDAPVQALQAIQGAFAAAAGSMAATQFDSVAQPWIKRSLGMTSLGWMDVSTVRAAAAGAQGAATSDEAKSALSLSAAPAVRHALGALPLLPSAAASAPPLSVLDLPAARQAAARAATLETPTASPPLPLGVALDARPGLLLLQRLQGQGAAGQQTLAFALLAPEALVGPIIATRGDGMRACLLDADEQLAQRRLAGRQGCEAGATADPNVFTRETGFDFAGRHLTLRTSQPVRTSGSVWLFALPALAGSALLAVLMSGMTGQVQRVRQEARTRTDELRHEIDERARVRAVHERTVHALMDTVQIGMALIDPDGRIRRVNDAFAELAGTKPSALQHMLLDDVLIDHEVAAGRFARLIAGAGDELVHQPMRLRNADARVLPALVTLRVLRDEGGHALSVVCAVHDLSENLRRRQVERVLGDVLDMSRRPDAAAGPASDADKASAECRLLCIAGDAGLDEVLRTALHDRPRMALFTARGGPEGLLMARTQAPQLVLVDMDLPDADSLALMRTLSGEGLTVVALSRDLRPQRIDEAFAAGARATLTLPLEVRELLAILDDLL